MAPWDLFCFTKSGTTWTARLAPSPLRGTRSDAWARRLFRQHARRHYWYFRPLKPVLAIFGRFARFMAARKRTKQQLHKSVNP
jgi:hypothetical protein